MRQHGLRVLAVALAVAFIPQPASAEQLEELEQLRTDSVLSVSSKQIAPDSVSAYELRATDSVVVSVDLSRDSVPSDRTDWPQLPIELAFAGLAAAKTGGRKRASAAAPGATAPPAAPPLTAAQKAAVKEAQADEEKRVLAARAPTADPDQSDNIKATGKFDETVEGGKVIGPDGKARNANGELLDKKKGD